MKQIVMLVVLGSAVAAIMPPIDHARAQPAAALGRPLPDGSLPAGTIAVRVVAGGPSSPVVGTEVTLLVSGVARVARTDSAGRAMFPNVPAGAHVQAKVVDAETKDVLSEAFAAPATGGVRLMLSTKPFTGTAGPGPATGGGGGGTPVGHGGAPAAGMPEARQMSGQPRPDRGVMPGSYQVRVTYNSLEIKDGEAKDPQPPVGETVALVGYRYDEGVVAQQVKVDAQGYAQFDGLDVTGNHVYFALTRLPRNGNVDRLTSVPVQLETQAGAKLILSSEKRTSTAPPIDDLAGPQTATMPPAGKVRVVLEGYPRELSEIMLIDAVTKQVVARGKPTVVPPDPSKVDGGAQFHADQALPAGTLDVRVHGGPGMQDGPLADVELRVVPAGAPTAADGIASKTGADGTVRLAVADKTKQHRLLVTVNGKQLASQDFELSRSGGRLDVTARWDEGGPEIVFDVPYNPAQVLYAETRQMSPLSKQIELFRSMPFLLVETTGAHAAISVLPRILFSFQLQAFVEDEILGVRGMWRIANNSWIPYRPTPDGLLIPLPKDHVGGVVGDEFQHEVSVAQGEGYRILRALPPGSTQWEAGFSLRGDDGQVRWHFDLPLGAFQSVIQIHHFPGLDVELPEGATRSITTGRSGTQWFTISDIMIPTNRSMVMTISGMPSHPSWKKWVPRIIGIVVALIMLGGVVLAVMRKPSPADGNAKRKQALIDELVEVEKTGVDPKRRDQLLSELERIWE